MKLLEDFSSCFSANNNPTRLLQGPKPLKYFKFVEGASETYQLFTIHYSKQRPIKALSSKLIKDSQKEQNWLGV